MCGWDVGWKGSGRLKPIRIPSGPNRNGGKWAANASSASSEVRRLENHGRALRIEFEDETLPAGWAGPRKWKRLGRNAASLSAHNSSRSLKQIRSCQGDLSDSPSRSKHWSKKNIPRAGRADPRSARRRSLRLAPLQTCKAIGSYTGCCPSEYSSGGVQRFGAIDRHGNKHVRTLLVEAVWRLLRWQPQWHARQKYLARLSHGASLKKKIAVALARQLAIDLWRWRTGRASAAELGWSVARQGRSYTQK